MLQRQTQTAAFWRDRFEVTPDDMDFLYNLLLDTQASVQLQALATALIQEYLRRENSKIKTELAKGDIYVPQQEYEIGITLVFPALEFAVGDIVEVRPGHNPEYGDFDVIAVAFAGTDDRREFATNLQTNHRLNQNNGDGFLNDDSLLSPQEIYSLYQEEIDESLGYALEEGVQSDQFVEVDGNWLLADMLAEVHIGHLNIAEAMIEMHSRPLFAEELLKEVELDGNVAPAMQVISLSHSLKTDQRFDPVEVDGQQAWFLHRLEPAEVRAIPTLLKHPTFRYNRALLSVELLQVEWELDDEWGESSLSTEVPTMVPNTSITLGYPHRHYGTIPLNGRTRSFFPIGETGRSLVKLMDGRWGNEYQVWVLHEGRYISGLSEWMEQHNLPVGAIVTLERTGDADQVVIDYRPRRPKREWARIVTADLENRRLLFEMNKIQVACEYDEYMITAEGESGNLEELRQLLQMEGVEISKIVEDVVPELTKLNPQGTVHAKSVYTAVNVLRRCAPGPIFYALISNRKFQDVGGGFFALA